VAAASADAVLLTFAPALPEAVPDEPAAGVPLLALTTLVNPEFPMALTLAELPIPLTVTWLFAAASEASGEVVVDLLLLETNEPEITPFEAS